MNYKLRLYTDDDYLEVKRWYAATDEGTPTSSIFPQESTLLLEANGIPVFCLIAYLTNCKEVCFFEGFIGNPDFRGPERLEASQLIVDKACEFVKSLGYKNALTFAYRDKVKKRIEELKFEKTLDNLSCFIKRFS